MTPARTLRTFAAIACSGLFAATAFASTVTGTVTNLTTGKPSAGDTIAVINTAVSMDEIAKATSDASGKFKVNAPDGGQLLLHVTHKGAEYFKSVPPGTGGDVAIEVYDSATKVDGIAGEALVLRAETDTSGKTLSVAENFFVQNTSSPPRTEYGANTFDFYLPKGAVVQQTLASSPNGLPTNTPVKTVDAASGHYAFTFPVRPGETRFQVAYTLPYSGKQPFSLKLTIPTGDVAVMLPKTMQFQPGSQFQPINPDVNAQSFDAHQPPVGQPIEFTLAGAGQLPDDQAAGQDGGGQGGGGEQPTAGGQRPGGGLGAPVDPGDTNSPLSKYKWLILTVLGLALICGAAIMLKNSPAPVAAGVPPSPVDEPSGPALASATAVAPVASAPGGQDALLHALKEELFALEADRLAGKLSDAQYAEQKAAFDVVLRRALSRSQSA